MASKHRHQRRQQDDVDFPPDITLSLPLPTGFPADEPTTTATLTGGSPITVDPFPTETQTQTSSPDPPGGSQTTSETETSTPAESTPFGSSPSGYPSTFSTVFSSHSLTTDPGPTSSVSGTSFSFSIPTVASSSDSSESTFAPSTTFQPSTIISVPYSSEKPTSDVTSIPLSISSPSLTTATSIPVITTPELSSTSSTSTSNTSDVLTTKTYMTTSGTSSGLATTTQTLIPSNATRNDRDSRLATNSRAIIGLSVALAVILLAVAIGIFLCLRRRRQRNEALQREREIVERHRSHAHLRNEVDDDDSSPFQNNAKAVVLGQEKANAVSTGSRSDSGRSSSEYESPSVVDLGDPAAMERGEALGVPNPVFNVAMLPTPPPALPRSNHFSDTYFRPLNAPRSSNESSEGSSSQAGSGVDVSQVPPTRVQFSVGKRPSKPSRGNSSFLSRYGIRNPMSRMGSSSTDVSGRLTRDASTRTAYTSTEESVPPITPPLATALGPGFRLENLVSTAAYSKQAGAFTSNVTRPTPPTLGALPPAFSFIPPTPQPEQNEFPVPKENLSTPVRPFARIDAEPSPALSTVSHTRDNLIDVDFGRERLRKMVRGLGLNTEETATPGAESLRDYVDYSRPLMLKDTPRMFTSSSFTSTQGHEPMSTQVIGKF